MLSAWAARPDPESDALDMLKQLCRTVIQQVVGNPKRTIASLALGLAVAWIANIVVVAGLYQGENGVPPDAPVTAPLSIHTLLTGGTFWTLGLGLLAACASYLGRVGPAQFGRDVRGLPRLIAGLLHGLEGRVEHLLWGFAWAMLLAAIVSPALSGLLALAIVPALSQLVRPLITGLMTLAWRRLRAIVGLRSRAVPSDAALSGALVGALPAMLLGYMVDIWIVKVAIMLAAFCTAIALQRKASMRPAYRSCSSAWRSARWRRSGARTWPWLRTAAGASAVAISPPGSGAVASPMSSATAP
jgi:hypothetical protein